MQLRSIVKIRSHFPAAEAATKLLNLVLRNIAAKWRRGNHAWQAPMPLIAMLFRNCFADRR